MPANSEEQRPQQRRSGDAQDTPAPAHAVSDNGMKAHLSSWTGKHEEVEGKHEEAREAPLPQSPPPSDDVPIADRRLVSAELDAQRSTAFRGDKEEWTRLRTFVHDTEEKSLLKPYTFPFGCTIDFEHIEAYFLSVLPLSMFVLFVAMINAFAFTDPDTDTIRMTGKQNASNFSSSANVSRGASASATVEGVLDPRAKMLAAASAGSKDNAVLTAFGAALNIILIGFIAFSCARHRVPQLYSRKCKGQPETTKGQRSNLDCLPARGRFGCFSWLPDLLRISDESMVDHIGFDAYIFLRLLQLASKFAAFSFLLVGGPLMVVYYHADGDPSAQGSLRMLTLSNVGQDDWRLWLCLAGMYVVSLLLVKLVSEEEMVYVRTRHRYFHQPRAQDYSCIVKDIPEAYRTNHDLLNLFRKFYPAADIDSVCVLPDCRALEKHVTKSKAIMSKLKEAKEARENGKAKLGFGCCAKPLNKLVPKLREELQELNELIHKEQLAVHRALQTTHQAELEALHLEEKEFFSHKASSAPNATDGGGGAKQHAKQVALHKAKGAQIRAAQALEAADKCMLTKIMCSVTCGALKESYGDTRQHGIVTFSNLRTATIARQVVHDSHVLGMELVIKEAPEPDDFCWRNAGMNKQERFVRGKLSVALDLWLLALWSVPVVAITAMTSVESLSLRFPILKPVVEQPFVKSFIEGTLPSIILTQFLNHLPSILRATSIYEGHISMSTIERHTVGKYYMFLVFNVFLLTTFSNGLLEGLEELVANPLELPNILARTLPSQSNFFLSYILVNGISTWWLQLLGAANLVKCTLLKATYEVQPMDFSFNAAKALLVLTLATNFAIVAPIVLLPAAFSFSTIYVVFKYKYMYMMEPKYESGGRMWSLFARCAYFAMLLAQFMLLGLFTIKKGYKQGPAMVPLLVYTYTKSTQVMSRFEVVARHLPLLECHSVGAAELQSQDEKLSHVVAPDFVHHAYYPDSMSCAPFEDVTAGTDFSAPPPTQYVRVDKDADTAVEPARP